MIVMDSKSQLTVDIIAKVAEGKIDIVNAGKVLNKSRRTRAMIVNLRLYPALHQ